MGGLEYLEFYTTLFSFAFFFALFFILKVWSDFKNNCKKKVARINRSISGTGGGPALASQLTDLEQRVVAIVGIQAATGLDKVEEAGFGQVT